MKHRALQIVYLIVAIAIVFVASDNTIRFSLLGALLFVYSLVIGLASYRFQWNFFMNATHHGKVGTLTITFDDGPHPEHTPAILEILKQHNVPATFFMIGKHVDEHPTIAKKVADAGHEIGNHSYNHRNRHGILSTQKVAEEIAQCNGAITKATGVHTHYYRPPFGVTNPNIASAVGHSNVQAIGWDIRSLDTTTSDADALLKRITDRLENGSILLLHDTQLVTVAVLPRLLQYCKQQGIPVVSLKESLKK